MLDSKLYFESHIEGINGKISKSRQGLGVMKQIKKYVSPRVLAKNYFAYVRPHLDYGDIIVHQAYLNKPLIYDFKSSSILLDKMDMVQYDAARIVTGAWRGSPRKQLFDELGWDSLNNRRIMRKLSLLHEIYYYKFPSYLDDILTPSRPTSRRQLDLPDEKTKLKIFPIGTH